MKYRSEAINKEKERNDFYLLFLFFIVLISAFTITLIHTKNNIDELTKEIPLLNTRLDNIKNSILSESKNRNNSKRFNSINKRAEQIGMVQSSESNIIQVWWKKGLDE